VPPRFRLSCSFVPAGYFRKRLFQYEFYLLVQRTMLTSSQRDKSIFEFLPNSE
jgi:hypothetical protein